MRIEILGPSGVGKTTTLLAAQGMRMREPEWIGPVEADEILQRSSRGWRNARGRLARRHLMRAAFDHPDRHDFIDHCLSVVTASSMSPSQKSIALSILQTSFYQTLVLKNVPNDIVLVHDELLLHRACSLLLYSPDIDRDAHLYFELVPLPDGAVLLNADEETVLSRVRSRTRLPNCYAGQDEAGLRRVIAAGIRVARIAQDVLRTRGLAVRIIESSFDLDRNARDLHEFLVESAIKRS